MRRSSSTSPLGTPSLIGAVTVLISITAVFLAYNANKGLPFVPTYNVSAQIPGGANLVEGNDVRVGGFQVGIISRIRPGVEPGTNRSIAIVDMKLDKEVEPLGRDTRVFVRPRSNLGLKYIEMTPGVASEGFRPGETIPLAQSKRPIELDEFFSTFNLRMRNAQKGALTGFGNALAGRGPSINTTIELLVPFVTHLEPVMRNLSDPRTGLKDFFKNIGAVSAQVAPVARVQAELFTKMADTFQAFNRCPSCLQDTIAKQPATLDTAIRSFRVQRPFLVDFADLSRRLIPAVNVLPTALPKLNSALAVGTKVLPQTVTLNQNTTEVFRALQDLVDEPSTGLALGDLRDTLGVTKPLINYVAPFQTVCNYVTYFSTGLGQHQSEGASNGTAERVMLKTDNNVQDNRYSSVFADRPVDLPKGVDPTTASVPTGALEAFHGGPYFPAIDAQGNADCQNGQFGYIDGPLGKGRYPAHGPVAGDDPLNTQFSRQFAGGSHIVYNDNFPGLSGPSFVGIKSLKDVP
jgi:virulence factor Mce-like protein